MADEYEFKSSVENNMSEDFIFESKEWIKLPDTNNGVYPSSQINWNLPSISNNDEYLSFKQSYIEIPYVINLEASTALASADKQAYACAIKGGFHNLVNSMSLTIDNNNIINFTELSNIPMHFKVLSGFSQDDVVRLGDIINFAKDTAESLNYAVATSVNGIGEYNNKLAPTTFSATTGYALTKDLNNRGLLARMDRTSFDPASTAESLFTNTTLALNKRKSYYVPTSTTVMTWHCLATIPMSFLTWDLFDNFPLCRGVFMKLTLAVHTGRATFTMATANSKYSAISSVSQYGVLPIMVSEGEGGLYKGVADSVINVSCNIGSAGVTSVNSVFDKKCYFNACMYKFTPEYESLYIEKVPEKKVVYTDIIMQQQNNISASTGKLNLLVTNGISKARWLLMVTSLSASVNGSTGVGSYVAGNAPFSTFLSPFTSSPCTNVKGCSWTNFQVKVAGKNFYPSAISYSYDMYLQEMRQLGVNGGLVQGVSSGLISLTDWESGGYAFVYVDLSRKPDIATDQMSRSIEVSGTNNCLAMVDVVVYCGYSKDFTINTITGKLIL